MSTLTLPDELAQGVAAASAKLAMSTDAFMVQALRRAVDAADNRSAFAGEALVAR